MSGLWSPQQVEWLQALGLEVLHLAPETASVGSSNPAPGASANADVPTSLRRAARGVDLAPLLVTIGVPRDVVTRRAFWRALRPLRKAASGR